MGSEQQRSGNSLGEPAVAYSAFKPDQNELPDSLVEAINYTKGRYEKGPLLRLGNNPEPKGTVYDTTVNPLPPSPAPYIPGRIPRYERIQIQLPNSRQKVLLERVPSTESTSIPATQPNSSTEALNITTEPGSPLITTSEDFLLGPSSSTNKTILESMMLCARRFKDFLTENVDEHATSFIFFTLYGTLLGHSMHADRAAVAKTFRKFAAFAGPTWTLHDTALQTTGAISPNPGFFGGKVLKLVIKDDSKGLQAMIVEQDSIISAVVYCKENTLIAAQLGKDKFSNTDDLVNTINNVDLQDADHAEDDDVDLMDTRSEDPDVSSPNGKGKGKARADTSITQGPNLSKERILELRAEAIAEVIAQEELPEFVMPKGFY